MVFGGNWVRKSAGMFGARDVLGIRKRADTVGPLRLEGEGFTLFFGGNESPNPWPFPLREGVGDEPNPCPFPMREGLEMRETRGFVGTAR